MKYQFSNVVVVENNLVGVVVKSWANNTHEVYVRYFNSVRTYKEKEMKHLIYDKVLDDDSLEFYQ